MAKKPKKAKKSKAPAARKAVSRKPAKPLVKAKVAPRVREVEEPGLTDSQIHKFRDILAQKRDDLLAVVQRKKEQEIQVGEAEIGDEADIATRSVEKEMLFELTDSEKQTLDMVEA